MPSQKVRLEIAGSSYVVSTNDSEEYLVALAERLDADMKKIMQEAPNASVTSAAVISALGYLDESAKNAFGADNMRVQIQDYLEDAAKAKMAAEEARREAEKLRNELEYYKSKEKNSKPKPVEKPVEKAVEKKERFLQIEPSPIEALSATRLQVEERSGEEVIEQLDGQLGMDEL